MVDTYRSTVDRMVLLRCSCVSWRLMSVMSTGSDRPPSSPNHERPTIPQLAGVVAFQGSSGVLSWTRTSVGQIAQEHVGVDNAATPSTDEAFAASCGLGIGGSACCR